MFPRFRCCGCLVLLVLVLAALFAARTKGVTLFPQGTVLTSVLSQPTESAPGYVSEDFARFALQEQRLASKDGFEAGAKIALAMAIPNATSDLAFAALVVVCGLLVGLVLVKARTQ